MTDLSNSVLEFPLTDIRLCIGSLQIHSLGNFEYLLDDDPNLINYPNKYHASRVFWSTKNARQKTIYHLHIDIEQTYHQDSCNHQTIACPLSKEQQLYEQCQQYFDTFQRKISNCQTPPSHIEISNEIPNRASKSIVKTITQSNDLPMNESSSKLAERNTEPIAVDAKTLRKFFMNDSKSFSQLAFALAHALSGTNT